MRIAFLVPSWPEGASGIVSYVRTLAAALHAKGHDIVILAPVINGRVGFEDTALVQFSSGYSRFASAIVRRVSTRLAADMEWRQAAMAIVRAIRGNSRKRPLDIVEMEETFGWCGIVSNAIDIPLVVRLHGPHFLLTEHQGQALEISDVRRIAREGAGIGSASLVTAPSEQVLKATETRYGRALGGRVIPNPVLPVQDHRHWWSSERADMRSLLFVGRTDGVKGGDLVLRVFDRLLKTHPDLTLHFVGPDRGLMHAGSLVGWSEYVRTNVSDEAQARIIYHGVMSHEQIADLRRKCGVTLVLSRYETFGIVCAEAMAVGSPLVASRVGGIPEIVRDGETGLLVDPLDLDDTVGKIARLLADVPLATTLGEAGREFCARLLDPGAVADASLAAYACAVGNRNRAQQTGAA